MSEELDLFGKIIVSNIRDKQFDYANRLLTDKLKAPELKKLQKNLSHFKREQKEVILELIEVITTNAMHDLLFELQEYDQEVNKIEILINKKNVIELSDGIHGEIFGEDGWINRFSSIKSEKEMER